MQERKGTSRHLETGPASAKIADYVISRRGILRKKTIFSEQVMDRGEGRGRESREKQ